MSWVSTRSSCSLSLALASSRHRQASCALCFFRAATWSWLTRRSSSACSKNRGGRRDETRRDTRQPGETGIFVLCFLRSPRLWGRPWYLVTQVSRLSTPEIVNEGFASGRADGPCRERQPTLHTTRTLKPRQQTYVPLIPTGAHLKRQLLPSTRATLLRDSAAQDTRVVVFQ